MPKKKTQKTKVARYYYRLYAPTSDDFGFDRPTLELAREKLKEMLERFPEDEWIIIERSDSESEYRVIERHNPAPPEHFELHTDNPDPELSFAIT